MKLRTIIQIYGALNETVFSNVLYDPRFFATRNRHQYAAYQAWAEKYAHLPSHMRYNLKHLNGFNVVSTVYHEMIHQYVEEFLGLEEEDHHGPIYLRNYNLFKPANVEEYCHEE